ncbi:hypothetical protein Droror1_Dr00021488 [Drosera rotundifolia]
MDSIGDALTMHSPVNQSKLSETRTNSFIPYNDFPEHLLRLQCFATKTSSVHPIAHTPWLVRCFPLHRIAGFPLPHLHNPCQSILPCFHPTTGLDLLINKVANSLCIFTFTEQMLPRYNMKSAQFTVILIYQTQLHQSILCLCLVIPHMECLFPNP